jgi:glutamyl-tRNA reductase
MLEMAIAAGARARSETAIGVGATSLAGAAVSLAERRLGDLAGRTALVIGAGHAGRLALARLAKRRAGRLLIANRSREAAETVAASVGATVLALDDVGAVLRDTDVVIAAAQSPSVLVTADVLRARAADRPLAIVDLSVPPIVDAAVARCAGVTLDAMEELRVFVEKSAAERANEVPRVEAIARRESRRLWTRLAGFDRVTAGAA